MREDDVGAGLGGAGTRVDGAGLDHDLHVHARAIVATNKARPLW